MKQFKIMSWKFYHSERVDYPTEIINAESCFSAYDKLCKSKGPWVKLHCTIFEYKDDQMINYHEVVPGVAHDTWRHRK